MKYIARRPRLRCLITMRWRLQRLWGSSNLNVILYNHSDIPLTVSRGDRIAQLICEKIYYPTLEEVEILDITERGERGFGSTGKN